MKYVINLAKGLVIIDLFGGLIYSVWAFSVLVLRQCGIDLACPTSSAKFVGFLAYPSKLFSDFYLYAIIVSVGHGMLWLPNFILSLACYRDICFSQWLLVNDVPSFETFMQLVSAR